MQSYQKCGSVLMLLRYTDRVCSLEKCVQVDTRTEFENAGVLLARRRRFGRICKMTKKRKT